MTHADGLSILYFALWINNILKLYLECACNVRNEETAYVYRHFYLVPISSEQSLKLWQAKMFLLDPLPHLLKISTELCIRESSLFCTLDTEKCNDSNCICVNVHWKYVILFKTLLLFVLKCIWISLTHKLPLASSTMELDSLVSGLSTEGAGWPCASTLSKNSSPHIFWKRWTQSREKQMVCKLVTNIHKKHLENCFPSIITWMTSLHSSDIACNMLWYLKIFGSSKK